MNLLKICSACHLPAGLVCSRCLQMYCSLACQIRDWPDHRRICVEIPRLFPVDSYLEVLASSVIQPLGNSVTTTERKSKALENNGRFLTPLRKPHFCFGASEVKALPAANVKREPEGIPSEKARNITVMMGSEKRMAKMEVGDVNSQGNVIEDRRPVESAVNKPQMWAKLQLQILKHKHVVADKPDGAEESTNKTQCDKVQDINSHVKPEGKSKQPPNTGNRDDSEDSINRGERPSSNVMPVQMIVDEKADLHQMIQDFQNLGKTLEGMSQSVNVLPPSPQPGAQPPLSHAHGPPPNQKPVSDYRVGLQANQPASVAGQTAFNPGSAPGQSGSLGVPTPQSSMPQQNQGFPPQRAPFQQLENYLGYPSRNQPFQPTNYYPTEPYPPGPLNTPGSQPQMYGPTVGGQYSPQAAGGPPMAQTYRGYGCSNAYGQPPCGYPPTRVQPSYIPPQQQYTSQYFAGQPLSYRPPSAPTSKTNPPATVPSRPAPVQTSSPRSSVNVPLTSASHVPMPPTTSTDNAAVAPQTPGSVPPLAYTSNHQAIKHQQPSGSYPQSAPGGTKRQGPQPSPGPVYSPYGYSPIPPPPGFPYHC